MAERVNPSPKLATKRPYRSALREQQAQLTRVRILDAAERLFLAQGFGATTIAAIAAEAEVVPDTVYATFASKRGILAALMDKRVVGDDEPVALLERRELAATAAEPDQHSRVRRVAAGIAAIHERSRRIDDLMLSAASSDPEIASLRADVQQRQRRVGMRFAVIAIRGTGGLRPHLDDEVATDVLWAIASPDVHRLLRSQRQWTPEQYEAWLADAIARLLVK